MTHRKDARTSALMALKLAHTAIWGCFVAAILAIPAAAVLRRFRLASWLVLLVLAECLTLALNRWRCPISNMADRLTENRAANFDIYLPEWLARWNKEIFGVLFALGLIVLALEWWRASCLCHLL